MNLVQFLNIKGERRVGCPSSDHSTLRILDGFPTVYELAQEAIRTGTTLTALAGNRLSEQIEPYDEVIRSRRLLVPFDHPDPARCWVSLTGLTHLGSAKSRDAMHAKLAADPHQLTDSKIGRAHV